MRPPLLRLGLAAAVAAALALPVSASAQTITDVTGTLGVLNTLTGISVPQFPDADGSYPDPATDPQQAPTSTAPQPAPTGTNTAPTARQLGAYCTGEPKKRPPGKKHSPFSQCVTAMSKLASGKESSPRRACAALSHRHAGPGKTPFGKCVSGGAKLLADMRK